MFLIIFSVSALILTSQNVWTKYVSTELENINYNYDINEVKDADGSLNDSPTLVTVVVLKNNSPRSEQYKSFEDSKEKILKNSFQNNKDDERIVPLPINIYDFIDFDDAVEGEMNLNLDNDDDNKDILRKKKKKKKKKKKTCKKACVSAAKSVCNKVDCSSKKKKSIAKTCFKKCTVDDY